MRAAGSFICATVVLVIIGGCFKPPPPVYDRPVVGQEKIYETAYVDPQFIYSDSLLSIIKAERVDSFLVDKSYSISSDKMYSLSFQVETDHCIAFIWVINNKGEVLLKLTERLFDKGFYKASCNLEKINDPLVLTQGLFIKAEICGQLLIEPIRR